jgi:hypothetical protein
MIRRYEPAILLAWSMVTAALSLGDVQHPIRSTFTLVFLGVIPGLAITRVLRLRLADRFLLAVPISLSLAALTSAVLVYSGYPSWDLGLSLLLAAAIGAITLDLARASITADRAVQTSRTNLDDETRQAQLIASLMKGGTLAEAAEAAGVSNATLQRALRRSDRLRMAVSVASHGELEVANNATDTQAKVRGHDRGRTS